MRKQVSKHPLKSLSPVDMTNAALDRATVITALCNLYTEWTEAADGQPLQTVEGSVGLLFEDVFSALGLTELEKGQVRGQWRKGARPVTARVD